MALPNIRSVRLLRDQRGLSTVEYVLLLVLLCALSVAAWQQLGSTLQCKLGGAASAVAAALGQSTPPATGLVQCAAVAGGPGGGGSGPGGGSSATTVPPLRQAYMDEVAALKGKQEQLQREGKSPEEIARYLHGERRRIGIHYKSLTPPELLEQVYQRNIEKYGDPLGPTVDYLRNKGKSWEEIADGAARSGGQDIDFNKGVRRGG